MSLQVLLIPAAAQDLEAIKQSYDQLRTDLGTRFVQNFAEILESIRSSPESFDPVDQQHRRAFVRRIPYVIDFTVQPEMILVVAVVHGSRRPDTWRQEISPN